jgi:tRNA-modifying protein YgfZ
MPSKPPPMPTPAPQVSLDAFGLLRLSGADAADFLQRQSMNDVRELAAPGLWHWNGMLSPKGRVLALFALLRTGQDAFVVIQPAEPADGDVAAALAERLQRSVFRSKLRIERLPDWRVVGLPGAAAAGPDPAQAEPTPGGWQLDVGSLQRPRLLRIGSEPAQPSANATAVADRAAWLAEDLRHGLPHVGPSLQDAWTPQMLGLGRLAAFSVKKGCYPGQEIVARTHFLGQAKRELALLAADRPFSDDERLQCGVAETRVLQQASTPDGQHLALAVLPIEAHLQACHREDGSTAQRGAFVEGLARQPRPASDALA